MMYSIYIIECSSSNKRYIGQTKLSLDDRLSNHYSKRFERTSPLALDMRKYKRHTFSIQLLDTCKSLNEAIKLETQYIKQFECKTPNGYNTLITDSKLDLSLEKTQKQFNLISPKGDIHRIKGLRQFCRDYNLCKSGISKLISQEIYEYKGWKLHVENDYQI